MDAMKLASAMSGLDDDLLHEADTAAGKATITPLYKSVVTWVAAACLILLLGGAYSLRGPVVLTDLSQSVSVSRGNFCEQLNIEIISSELFSKNLEVSDGTISIISKDGSIEEFDTPCEIKGKTQIVWNISPNRGETYYLSLEGGLITKTLVLEYDESKNEWSLKKKTNTFN